MIQTESNHLNLRFLMQWKKTDHVLKPEKVQRLTGLMDKAMKGVRRIAALSQKAGRPRLFRAGMEAVNFPY